MVYRLLAKIYPKKLRENYTELLKYLEIKINPDVYVGFTVLVGIFLSIGGAFIVFHFYPVVPFVVSWFGLFLFIETLIYIPLMLKVDKNASVVENMLPDALQLMSSNLKSGLTVDQSLLASARPEFGIFEKELNRIGKEVATGKIVEQALMDSSKRIKSEKYEKTMELISSGLRSGGELAKLLDQTSSNLKHQMLVDQKVRSNVMMYVIFIFSAIVFGAPVLFGLSSFLVEVLTDIFGSIDIPDATFQAVSIPSINVDGGIGSGFIITYIVISMAISSIMGGLIIGLISRGKEKYGLKYIPVLFFLALFVFLIIRFLISQLLGDIISI